MLQSISCRRFSLAQLQSITTWLLRHGLYVRSLNLFCYPHDTEAEACAWDLAASLGALAASGLLQQLRLGFSSMRTALHVTSWCSALRQLRELQLFNRRGVLRISSSLAGLSTVTGLDLIGGPVVLDAAVQLPPNVEWLCLFDDCERAELPEQVRYARAVCSQRWVLVL